jgi:hypothetical protein
MNKEDIKIDHIYAPALDTNLRCVVAITSDGRVEYDSLAVPLGAVYPSATMEEFLQWAGQDVTYP